ncbi:MAG: DNA mismatch repair protein MutS [Deltaproteobacteria bacterium]|nr:DNA mismatch repair protein MutS [Deltaproteobacteria bacterium]
MARSSTPIEEKPREPVPVDRTPEDLQRTGKLTPMLQQYLELKATHQDCLLLFRLGDFYECFFQDAVQASEILDITLTARGKGEDRFPMAGIPHHASRGYIARLIEAGRKVAIADQVEDAAEAKGLVKRDVVRVITPGVVLDEDVLEGSDERLLGTVVPAGSAGEGFALALLEISTGALRATELPGRQALAEELARCGARELLLAPELCAGSREEGPSPLERLAADALREATLAPGADAHFGPKRARKELEEHFGVASLEGFGVPAGKAGEPLCRAVAAALRYVEATQKRKATHVDRLTVYSPEGGLTLDATSRANLEVVRTLRDGKRKGSLLGLIDRTVSAVGGRTLTAWLLHPLGEIPAIDARLDAVAHLHASGGLREELQAHLTGLPDLERVLARLSLGQGSGRDLKAVERALERLPALAAALAGDELPLALRECGEELGALDALHAHLAAALVDEMPATLTEGGIFRKGYNPDLDEILELGRSGKQYLLDLETRERERTGIGSLKVRYNRVFGYYIEIGRAKAQEVPADYVRRQTMKNNERFITEELQQYEAKVLSADERRKALERELFEALREEVVSQGGVIGRIARRLGRLDALLSLARVAVEQRWVRPVVDTSRDLVVEGGRHPVIEDALRQMGGEAYVPGDLRLDDEHTLLVITGPNMAGKSTVMRKAAILTLLAQAGSFVPARSARVGLTDRIFTRVGASDDLSRGQSTFMVEMNQTAAILHHATDRSLVILDEIGRGTSTFDGLSIAWAVAEHLHDVSGARTLFATHYHELADLAKERPRVANYTMAVREWNEKVIFLRTLIPGAASRSYGIQVARLAGLPREVLERAAAILAGLEASELDSLGRPAFAHGDREPQGRGQLALFGAAPRAPSEVEKLLAEIDPDALTPREAQGLLYRLVELLSKAT